jgi:hypothetical protein
MVALAALIQIVLPLAYVKMVVALALVSLGVFRLLRRKHFAWGGMQVGFRDLTIWSFLMASAHGAGLMVLPIILHTPSSDGIKAADHVHPMHMASSSGPWTDISATLVHTLGYVSVTALVAIFVYRKFGLALLRKGWFNLDLVWAAALIITGCVAMVA